MSRPDPTPTPPSPHWGDTAVRLWVRAVLDTYPGGDRAQARQERELDGWRQRAEAAERRVAALEQELAAVKASRTWRAVAQVHRIRRGLRWAR